jgi:protein TonB
VRITTIEPAMLLRKIEPVYPFIAIQTRREGRVELRAIIATDGTIQALEVLSGDPMFFPSALDAVRQWRYRPTILNGVPVEVETHITVIYNLQR